MKMGRPDEALLVRYLLGNLSEEKQVEVEDRAFADADYRSALEAAEADLIDAYVRGELSQADRRAFEARFLTSPQRRDKVEFARALAAAPRGPITPSRQSVLDFIRGWTPTLRFAVAFAVLLCVAGVSWFVVQNKPQRAISARETGRPVVVEQAPAPPAPPEPKPASPIVATLVLFAGITRGDTAEQQLVLEPDTEAARVEVQLEARDDYPKFRADLRTSSGHAVVTRSNLTRRRTRAGYAISFDLPAGMLKAGQYELAIKGVREGEPEEDVSYSYFSVRRR